MAISRFSDSLPAPAAEIEEAEIVAIAAFLLLDRHESAGRYGLISSAEQRIESGDEVHE